MCVRGCACTHILLRASFICGDSRNRFIISHAPLPSTSLQPSVQSGTILRASSWRPSLPPPFMCTPGRGSGRSKERSSYTLTATRDRKTFAAGSAFAAFYKSALMERFFGDQWQTRRVLACRTQAGYCGGVCTCVRVVGGEWKNRFCSSDLRARARTHIQPASLALGAERGRVLRVSAERTA